MVDTLCTSLGANTTLMSLSLNSMRLRDKGLAKVVEVLKNNKHIRYLDLSDQDISPTSAPVFADFVRTNDTVKELLVKDNDIETEGIFEFAKALKENKAITKLTLDCNGDADEKGAKTMGEAVAARSMEKFVWNSSSLGNKIMVEFLKPLADNTSLTELDLKHNSLSEAKVTIAGHLARIKNLAILVMSDSSIKSSSGFSEELAQLLSRGQLPHLEAMYLAGNSLNGRGGRLLAQAALAHSKLKIVNSIELRRLQANDPKLEDVMLLSGYDRELQHPRDREDDLRDEPNLMGTYVACKALSGNTHVKRFGTSCGIGGGEGLELIADMLEENETITLVDMQSANLDNKGIANSPSSSGNCPRRCGP
jgi:Leucine-rich repeat (LRR) protein